MPIPGDYGLNVFLTQISSEITDEDLQKLKYLLEGDGGFGKRVLEGVKNGMDYFRILRQSYYLNRENLIFLQANLWHIGRKDLHRRCVEFARTSGKALHFYVPKEQPENGYSFIKFHVAGSLDTFQRPHLELVRNQVSQLMGCRPENIFVAGIEPANSLLITLMVPTSYIDLWETADKVELGWLRVVDVDKVVINDTVFETPCYGGYHASEIREILRKHRFLESQLDVTRYNLLLAEKEKEEFAEKAHSSLAQYGAKMMDFRPMTSTPVKFTMQQPTQVAFVLEPEPVAVTSPQDALIYTTQTSDETGSDALQDSYTKTVKVENLPVGVNKDEIKAYFENRRDHGGGPIRSISFSAESGEAVINFEDSKTVERLLQSKPVLFKDHYIKIEPFKWSDASQSNFSDLESDKSNVMVTVEVKGFRTGTTSETIEDYFENEKSGGQPGGIELPIEVDRGKNVAYIKFKKKQVAEDVLLKKDHKLEGVILEVKEYIPPPITCAERPQFYKDKILVSGMSSMTSKDGLCNFLSNRAGGDVDVTDICMADDNSKAVVTFSKDIDIKRLQKECWERTLDEKYLDIESVPVTQSIIVMDVLHTTSKDCLEMHFRYRVNGGEIEKIDKLDEDRFIIQFKDPKVILDICTRYHKVDDQEILVSAFYECLGPSQVPGNRLSFSSPEGFTFKEDSDKLYFLQKSIPVQERLHDRLSTLNAVANLEDLPTSIFVECTLSPSVPEFRSKAKKWERKVTKDLEKFFRLVVIETQNPLKDVLIEIENEKEELESAAEGNAVIWSEEDEVKVIGWKESVPWVSRKLRDFILEANAKLEKRKNQITETFKVKKPLTIRILEEQKFCEKTEQCKVSIDTECREVKFEGNPTEVYQAKCNMLELLHHRSQVPIGPFSKDRLEFLKSQSVQEYLNQELRENKMCGFTHIRDDDYIEINAENDTQAVEMARFIKSTIIETPRAVSDFDVPLLKSKKYQEEVKKIEAEYNDRVRIVTDFENLQIKTLMVSVVERNVLELIDNFLQENIMIGEALSVPHGLLRYVKQFCMDELTEIACDLGDDYHTQIKCTASSICVVCTEQGVHIAEEKIMSVMQSISKMVQMLERPSIVKYLMSENAQEKVHSVEKEFNCVITSDNEDFNTSLLQHQQSVNDDVFQVAYCETLEGRKISVSKHDLTDMMVDVIVNAADKELKLEGGLALVIRQKAGEEMFQMCQKYIKANGKLEPGEVFCCPSSGNLACRAVIHAVGPVWQDGSYQEAELLREAVFSSLEKCEEPKNMFKSIAIPAISTGVFNYPVEMAASVIIETLNDYFREKPKSVIQEVHLCDIKTHCVEAFSSALQKSFSNTKLGQTKCTMWKRLTPREMSAGTRVCSARCERKAYFAEKSDSKYTLGESLTKLEPGQSSIQMTLYGSSQEQRAAAFEKFEELVDSDYIIKSVNDPILKDMTQKQISKLKVQGSEFGVHLDFEKLRIGRIKIHGLYNDVLLMFDAVQKMIRKSGASQLHEHEVKYFQRDVEWKKIDEDGQEIVCEPYLNMMIEKHYRKNETRIQFQIKSDEWIVDFSDMKLQDATDIREHPLTFKLFRNLKSQDKKERTLPSHWSPMSDDDNLITIPLKQERPEYKKIANQITESLDRRYSVTVVSIERIQNQALYTQYSAMKEFMENRPSAGTAGPIEHSLWHITDIDSTQLINMNGFNRTYSNRKSKSLGQGVYFDTSLAQSLDETEIVNDAKYVIVYQCQVLTGKFTKGSPDMTVPPEIKEASRTPEYYDSVVDDESCPQTYAIFRDCQAYPEYMIKLTLH